MENFSIRTQSLLLNAGISSLEELSQYTAAELLKFRNFGYKSLKEVEPYLKTFDFSTPKNQIEKLEAEKAELVSYLEHVLFYVFWNGGNLNLKDKEKIESLIQKHKQ